jgi:CRP-like cAMP-binding protein
MLSPVNQESRRMPAPLQTHPERNSIRLKLRENVLLTHLDASVHAELAALLAVVDGHRGDFLLRQGDRELRQYFVLDGLLKRTVTSTDGREMTLRFATERDMETGYDAWRLGTPALHSVVCVTKARVAYLPIVAWSAFLDRHRKAKQVFEECVMRVSNAMMGHAVTLHLLDAPGRVQDFSFRHPQLMDCLPQKELAAHLNLSAETLCRLVRRHKPPPLRHGRGLQALHANGADALCRVATSPCPF